MCRRKSPNETCHFQSQTVRHYLSVIYIPTGMSPDLHFLPGCLGLSQGATDFGDREGLERDDLGVFRCKLTD